MLINTTHNDVNGKNRKMLAIVFTITLFVLIFIFIQTYELLSIATKVFIHSALQQQNHLFQNQYPLRTRLPQQPEDIDYSIREMMDHQLLIHLLK